MDIHFFQDSLGHYSSSTCNRINNINIEYKLNASIIFVNITNNKFVITSDLVNQVPEDWNSIKKYLSNLKDVNNVYFHNYNYLSQHILFLLKNKSKITIFNWVFWSAEFYNLPEISTKFYIGNSAKYHPNYNFYRRFKFKLFHFKEMLLNRPYYCHKSFINSFNELNCFFSFLKSDYDNVIKYSKANLNYKIFSYLSFEQFFGDIDLNTNINLNTSNLNIMINHNGDPILNHFDALERLKLINYKYRLILPVAYGDKKYINKLKEYCEFNFDNNLVDFWEEFIKPNEYSKKLLDINVAIFK